MTLLFIGSRVTTDTRKTRSATEWQLNNLKNLADTIILKANKLVKNRREGKLMYYSLDDEHVKLIFEAGYRHIMEDK